MMSTFRVLVLMSLRNILSHKVKTLIVGAIMAFGTFLLVLGTSILDSIETSMAQSIVSSLAGHLQVYDGRAKDPLALFGGLSFGSEDIGEIPDYSKVREELAAIPNVKATVPMGLNVSVVNATGDMDRELEILRGAVARGDTKVMAQSELRVRHIVGLLKAETGRNAVIGRDKADLDEKTGLYERVLSDAFWTQLRADPTANLQWLDTKIAPLAPEGRILYMRLLGTDLPLFAKTFDRFEVSEGKMIEPGERGILLSRTFFEKQAKDKAARDLDKIYETVVVKGRSIDKEKALQDEVARLRRQASSLAGRVKPESYTQVEDDLRARLRADADAQLPALVEQLFTLTDTNLKTHHDLFYEVVAPRMEQLYAVAIGDVLTLRAVSKTGYFNAVNVKVHGIYAFKGLEKSDLAGAVNVMDLITFRELYGQFTEEQQKEMAAIRADVGVKVVEKENVEDALFGGDEDSLIVAEDEGDGFDEFAGSTLGKGDGKADKGEVAFAPFTQDQVDTGLVLNIAVLLDDASKLEETQAAIAAVSKEKGLELNVVDWRTAAGIIGQFMIVTRAVLWIAIFIIFLVALVIINNSMVMATMERTGEVGTMRAIGAQRRFVLTMFLVETLVLGAVAGSLGALGGVGLVTLLGSVGIPAVEDVLVLLFAGPRLYPTVGPSHVILAMVVIFLVSVVSTLYPAYIATRIQPVVAMQRRD
jgi:ABC-type lipoprotein release transport system permease subunit